MKNVKVDEDNLLDMIMDRVEVWTEEKDDAYYLFQEYYEREIDGGFFDGAELDINAIVDNDYINWTTWGTLEDIKSDFGDNFTEDNILAEYNDLILYYAC